MYVEKPKSYGPGDILSFQVAGEASVSSLAVSMEPQQDLNGYDSPWPAGGGKNIFPGKNLSEDKSGVSFASYADATISIHGQRTVSSNVYFNVYENSTGNRLPMAAGTYTFSGKGTIPTGLQLAFAFKDSNGGDIGVTAIYLSGNGTATRTIEQDFELMAYFTVHGDARIDYDGGIQVEVGSTATSFAPYYNVCPLTGWSGVNIYSSGNNMLNPNALPTRSQYTVNADGTITVTSSDSTAWSTINPVTLLAGTYTVSIEGQTGYSQFRTSEDNYGSNKTLSTTGTTFTLTKNGGIKFKFNLSGTYPTTVKVQIELGTVKTEYSAFNGNAISITFSSPPGIVYSGTLDVVSGVLTVDKAKETKLWSAMTNASVNTVTESRRMSLSATAAGSSARANSASNITGYKNSTADTVHYQIASGGTFATFYLPKNTEESTSVELVYQLATPVTYQLTAQQISLPTGANNIFNDAGQTSISFVDRTNEGGTPDEVYRGYLEALRGDFVKLAKLEFLNPNGNVAFALDNNPLNKRSGAFIQSGTISCNLQNGRRRQASVTLHNLDHAYEFAVNHIWFGQQIRLSEGLILPDGTEYYIPQGVFEIETPAEALKPGQRTVTYNLVDKWANLDGTHFGNLEDVYGVTVNTNILSAIEALLKLDRFTMANNGSNPIDSVAPLFTEYYNDKTQTLTDGTVVSLIQAPYDFVSASTGTLADVVLGLVEMIAGDVGYNQTGRLVVNPSQDDLEDQNKPVQWEFTENDKTFLGADYSPKPADVYNDVIVVGATSDENLTARGRAQNQDPTSDTCVSRIGRKTIRLEMPNYYSDTICEDYAMWQLKRYSTMSKSVTVTCTQMFHIVENQLITVQRSDKPGSPIERHVVQGFSRPIGQTGTMTINCISTEDYPEVTLVQDT